MALTFIEEIANYFQANDVGTREESIFVSEMPDEETDKVALVIQEFPGGQATLNDRAPLISMGITVRATSYAEARAKAAEVFNLVHAHTDVTLENSRVLYFACGTAGSIGTDSRNRELVRMNLVAKAHAYDPEATPPPPGEEDGSDTGGGKDPNPGEFPGGGGE